MQKVRRPEFRKARKNRRQHTKRHPLPRLFRDTSERLLFALNSITPELGWLRRIAPDDIVVAANGTKPRWWGGNVMYFDLPPETWPSTDQ